MKCPHCLEAFHDSWEFFFWTPQGHAEFSDADGKWNLSHTKCPACNRLVIKLTNSRGEATTETIVRPKAVSRTALSADVPDPYATDYREACLVLAESPKASAALSRRCLQSLIRGHFGIKKSNLSDEIDALLDSARLPSYIGEAVDAVRNIGNFSAHPLKSTNSGEIMDVELGEAEWCLDVLESLFDFCFVQPALLSRKRTALNQRLSEAGKPPMK